VTETGQRAEAAAVVALTVGRLGLTWRHPDEGDHPGLVGLVDDWYGGRKVHPAFGRFLLAHFASTSLLAETAEGKVAGYLIGFMSPDHPEQAVLHTAAVNPNLRRRGIGRELYRRFGDLARDRGATLLVAPVWPGDPIAVAFHRALDFEPRGGDGAVPLYGTLAWPDYDFPGEDRVIFVRRIDPEPPDV